MLGIGCGLGRESESGVRPPIVGASTGPKPLARPQFEVAGEPRCASCGKRRPIGEFWSTRVDGTSYGICEGCSTKPVERVASAIRARMNRPADPAA